ncbi:MAG: aminotransferase class V-fold PLP-dependent enzyme [Pirellulaceae bacterium]
MSELRFNVDEDWAFIAENWDIRSDTTYLNHGSFGPSPRVVREKRAEWIRDLDSQPMDFYVRRLEPLMGEAREKTAQFFGTQPGNFVFVENATFGMNVVAESFPLDSDDEVLLNNHEYGAVHRIWNRRCGKTGSRVASVNLPDSAFESAESLRDALLAGVTPRTRLVVLSHITSAPALIWPLEKIIPAFRERGISVCIDGPHAPAQIELALDNLNADFYVASCHKWLCGPLGTGFLYAHPRNHSIIQPTVKSWGRLLPAMPERWDEEFTWSGTADPSRYLSIPTAIEFMESIGLKTFRDRAYWLASYAEKKIGELTGTKPIADRNAGWYGTMAHVPLPPGDWSQLQDDLFQKYGIETPVIHFDDRWFIRVSGHLYVMTKHIDYLVDALKTLLKR